MKSRSLIILVVVFAVLIGCYFGISVYQKNKAVSTTDESIVITDIESVSEITYTSQGTEFDFIKDDGTWYYNNDRNFPLSQSYPGMMANTWGKATAVRMLTDADDPSAYGLDSPTYTIMLKDTSGNAAYLYVGSATGENYYAATGDKSTVYTVSSSFITYLSYSLDDFIQLDTFPTVTSSILKSVTIKKGTVTTAYNSDDNSEAISGIAGGLGAFSAKTYAAYYASGDALTAYGLDEASRTTVEFTYTKDDADTTYTMYIGGLDADGSNYYVQLQDSNIIYTQGKEVIENILDTNESDKSGTDTGTVTDSSADNSSLTE